MRLTHYLWSVWFGCIVLLSAYAFLSAAGAIPHSPCAAALRHFIPPFALGDAEPAVVLRGGLHPSDEGAIGSFARLLGVAALPILIVGERIGASGSSAALRNKHLFSQDKTFAPKSVVFAILMTTLSFHFVYSGYLASKPIETRNPSDFALHVFSTSTSPLLLMLSMLVWRVIIKRPNT